MIQTSYFGKAGLLWTDPRVCAISLTVPRGYHGRRYSALAPTREMLDDWRAGRSLWNDYVEEYQDQVLDRLDSKVVGSDLDGCILLCWCGPGKMCHRRLVSTWLAAATGEQVPEWEPEPSYKLVKPSNRTYPPPLPPGELEDRLDRFRPHTTVEEESDGGPGGDPGAVGAE